MLAEVFTILLPISSGVVATLCSQCLLPDQQPSQASFPSLWQRAQSFVSPEMCCPEPALPRLNMSFHRRHGVLLLQCPQGWLLQLLRETNYPKADPADTSQSSSHVDASPPQKAPLRPANTLACQPFWFTISIDPVHPEISGDKGQRLCPNSGV